MTPETFALRVVCRASDESAVRSQMLNLIRQTTLMLRSIDSRDLDRGTVEVVAQVVTAQRAEMKVERAQIVRQLPRIALQKTQTLIAATRKSVLRSPLNA